MTKRTLPAGPEAITADWLTEALRSTHTIGEAAIDAIDLESIGQVEGFTGQVARFWLHYAGDACNAPKSLIAKFPAADPKRRALSHRLGYSAREHRFYQQVAPRSMIRVPLRYYSDIDAQSGDAVLLLEDLGGWTCLGDQSDGCSRAAAELILAELAKFHATWWHDAKRDDLEWVPSFALGASKTQETYRVAWWPSFVEKMESALPGLLQTASSANQLGSRLGDRIAAVKMQLGQPPLTIVHLDCRPDNLFVARGSTDSHPALIDWENAVLGRGPLDVAYFLISSLSTEQRRASEDDLLRHYHASLVEHGVRDYGFEQCIQDFRLSFIQPYVAIVYAVTVLDTLSTARGRKVIEEVVTRIDAASADHALLDLVA